MSKFNIKYVMNPLEISAFRKNLEGKQRKNRAGLKGKK